MASDVTVDLEVDDEVDGDELEVELGDVVTAETELTRDGLEIEVNAEIERMAVDEYEEPEFDDSATDETVEEFESDVETVHSPEDDPE